MAKSFRKIKAKKNEIDKGKPVDLFSTEESESTNVDDTAFNYMLESSQDQNEDLFKEDRELTKVLDAPGISHGVQTGATGMFSGHELSEEAKDNLLIFGSLLPQFRAWRAGAAISVRMASIFNALQEGDYQKALTSAPFLSSAVKAQKIGSMLDKARKVQNVEKLSRAGRGSSDVAETEPFSFVGIPEIMK